MSEEKNVLLRMSNLKQYFPIGKKKPGKPQSYVKANDGLTLDIYEGETFGLVGESGCGKSTFGRTLLQLYKQTGGRTVYYGRTIEDFDLKYVENIFKNLPEEKKKCEELQQKISKMREEYEKMPEGIAKMAKDQEIAELESEARNKLLDITALIGGIYTASDLTEAGKHYLAEYQAMKEIRRIRAEVEKIKVAGKGEEKIPSLESQIPSLEKKVEEEIAEISKIREANRKNPEFDKYESQRDNGINLAALTDAEMRFLRRDLQLIFQDPYSSLNPRMTLGQIIGEGLQAHGMFKKNDPKMQDYVMEVMEKCGLASYFIHRYPHQFSGGQRQRIGIARSLAVNPKFVVCDEAVSALDVSIQSQIINLLLDLKEQNNLTYLFISHDLSVIKYISDRIGVMYLGNMVELSTTEKLFEHPYHPYTEALLSAIPTTDVDGKKEAIILEGDIPSPINPPKGCKFHTRCRYCTEVCEHVTPEWEEVEPGHFVACHHKLEK
ncbi:MAG: ATP-binding cassette domain-containing protein [Clostridiales bacterium]|nr:ATP-binding cassette domain-containing protein [Clostridiales bacterium]